MASLIRFKPVEIDSNICFLGKRKRSLKYPVRSLALVPDCKKHGEPVQKFIIPEIFWQ